VNNRLQKSNFWPPRLRLSRGSSFTEQALAGEAFNPCNETFTEEVASLVKA